MSLPVRYLVLSLCLLFFSACTSSSRRTVEAASVPSKPAPESANRREIRIPGIIQAVQAVKITVPMIQGNTSNMTLTSLIANGSHVEKGDLVATFDPTTQMDAARDAQAKFEDLGHQVDQRMAENRVSAEKRATDLRQAQADLDKANLEMKRSQVLSPIDYEESKVRAEGAITTLASLKKSQAAREKSEAAGLRSLELQRDRQKINMQRAQDNIKKLELRAPLAGMLVHDLTYRANSYGHAQIGDQMYRSYPLVSIFDPTKMQVRCSVNEADARLLTTGGDAIVRLDAYPDIAIPAHFVNASPVASSALGSPIKSFSALFAIDKPEPHLLPDLSAAVEVTLPPAAPPTGGAK